jgi:competence protein ComEC
LNNVHFGWIVAVLLIASVLIWTSAAWLPDGKLHVYVLDVGQGESILIRTPSGQNILIDTGPDPHIARVQLGKNLPFWDRQIDLLILTQPQADHNSGAVDLIRNYSIKNITMPPLPSNSEFTRRMDEEIHRKGLASLTLIAGEYIMLERGIRLSVLHPPVALLQGTGDDINNNTSVLRLEWDKVSFLLTSDIAEDAEKYLLQNRANLRSSVLKVAHHGSRGSTCDSFLAAVHPSAAVISAGEGNRFGHPHREIIDRLATQTGSNRVYNTILDGSIEFITDGKKLWCRTEHAR